MKNAAKKGPRRPGGTAPSAPPLAGWKLWLMRLAAVVLAPLLLLTILNLILRLAGVGHPTAFLLPSTNHGQKTFVQNNTFGWRFFGKRKSRSPAAISILREKPPDVTRIFVFGESAAFGDPQPAFGLPRVLQTTLALRHPGMKFEVINAAMTAINSHVIRDIASDCGKAGGDVWVIYMGNNEVVGPFGAGTVFGSQGLPLPLVRATLALKATRLGQLFDSIRERVDKPSADKSEWGGMLMFLNQQVPEKDPRLAQVYRSFEKNLEAIIRTGRNSGASVVVSTVAVNLKDCAPFASQGQNDGENAEAQFRLGRQWLARGDNAGAQKAFIRARDLDTLRFRCDSRLNDIIRRTASGREADKILLADAEQAFAAASPDGLPGWNFFYEHVHLTFEGNCLLARTLAEQIEKVLPPSKSPPAQWPTVADCARHLGRTEKDLQTAEVEILGRLADPPFATQLNHDEQIQHVMAVARDAQSKASPAQALQAAHDALQSSPDDAELYRQLSELELSSGDATSAEAAAQRATDLLPSSEEYWAQLGTACVQEKKFDTAAAAFEHAFELNPQDVSPLQNAAMAFAKQGKNEEAMREYRRALAVTPRFGLAWLGLGELLESSGKKEQASACFQKGLQNRIHRAPDLATLARFCMNRGWLDAAATNFDEATQLDPLDSALSLEAGRAHFLLGMELGKSGQNPAAAEQFQQAVRFMPDVVEARLNLGIALYRAGQYNTSLSEFEQVAARSPTNALARHYLALLQKRE